VNANLGSLLTREEQVAIYCYTLDTILYKRVNYALRALNEPLLTAYTPYLKFFHRGVAKLPRYDEAVLICRSDGFDYGSHPVNSRVFLPMSFSVSEQYCTFRNTPVTPTCTYARIYSWSFRFLFGGLASIDGEAESLMLPGSVAVVLEDTPRNSTHCRNISLLEINKQTAGTKVTSLIPLFQPSLAVEIQPQDDFLHGYYKPTFTVRVPKTQYVKISTAGGYGDPYNPWPYIASISGQTAVSANLTVGQIIVAVNEYTTRGMLHKNVQLLLDSTYSDIKTYTDYIVAAR
jgi:hypothetical protein